MLLTACSANTSDQRQYPDVFINTEYVERPGAGSLLAVAKDYLSSERLRPEPIKPLPVQTITADQLTVEKQNVVYRIGHSTLLLKLDGQLILTDPMFSERASPSQWVGPKRFHPVPIRPEDLPPIDVVVISHDHYDHLDQGSVEALADKTAVFLVPLKVKPYLVEWGVRPDKIIELNWWESVSVKNTEFVLTPAQHFSGRGVLKKDNTLWGSWVMLGENARVFFSGDSGYFGGFKRIGKKYGPFDLTLIETGAYNSRWPFVHMFPEQSVQAHIDLNGKVMMPIHNCTFDLSTHDWNEPLLKAFQSSKKRDVTMVAPQMGERLVIGEAPPISSWWK
ncbi:hydrolase [Veronia nyctiphanis]|uniref:Hydrolase n=2 Tax=Veronia nyctiphanis TaxID=1278244 RepID=A0A4Q0YUD0_9GAMM|nr:MBL fold metallo-hydrolase [Veronia nyctiphanis]RXJ74385.1 hydrolase [Veronia nyctiphanis]